MSKLSPFEAAVQYHINCETYDRTVCTGPMGRDGILPADGYEQKLINANSGREFSSAVRRAEIPPEEMHKFISSHYVIDESIRRMRQSEKGK